MALELVFTLIWVGLILVFGAFAVLDEVIAMVLAAAAILIVVIGAIAYAFAYYNRFEYELTEDTFDVHSGVFSRRNREIPYYRVQNVSISKNIIHRLLGIAEVRIETAGGTSSEVHLRFVSEAESRRLQEEVSDRKRAAGDEAVRARQPGDPLVAEVGTPLFQISPTELALLGVVSFDTRLAVLVLAGVAFFGPEAVAAMFDVVPVFVFAPIAIIGLYIVSAAVSGVVAVTNYWDFRLNELPDELRYERGLLRQYSGSIPLEKIQTVVVSENVLARRFGYGKLLIETAGYSPGEASGSQTAVPLATRERVFSLARSIEAFDEPRFIRPPARTRQRYLHRYVYLVGALTGVAYAVDYTGTYELQWYLVPALLLLAPVAAHLKWRHIGFTIQDDYVITRYGFWNRQTYVVPYHRVQTVFEQQTILQRRWDLASVRIDTAGTRSLGGQDAVAPDIDAATAAKLREFVHDEMQRDVRVRRSPFEWLTTHRDDIVTPGSW